MPPKLIFRRTDKIRKSAEYKPVYEQGSKAFGQAIKVYFHKGERTAFGVVVNKRIKGAAKRNRYKRLLREFFRLKKRRFKPGTQIVAIVTRVIEKPTLAYFETEFDKIKQFNACFCENSDDQS